MRHQSFEKQIGNDNIETIENLQTDQRLITDDLQKLKSLTHADGQEQRSQALPSFFKVEGRNPHETPLQTSQYSGHNMGKQDRPTPAFENQEEERKINFKETIQKNGEESEKNSSYLEDVSDDIQSSERESK